MSKEMLRNHLVRIYELSACVYLCVLGEGGINEPLLDSKKIRLVDKYHTTFFRINLVRVRLQVGAVVQQWLSGIYNLYQQITALDHTPQLTPKFEILLVRSQHNSLGLFESKHVREGKTQGF